MDDILKAREEVRGLLNKANPGMEIARVIGEPYDPEKPFTPIVERICDTDTVDVGDDIYTFEPDEDTKEVHVLSSGIITSLKVTPGTPTLMSFNDIATKEYYITVGDMLKGKYDVLARKRVTIERSLNGLEIYEVMNAIATACPGGNKITGASFTFPKLVDMIEKVENYGGAYLLICGSTIAKQVILWNYNENKYHALDLKQLDVEKITLRGSIKKDGSTKTLLDADTAYLVAVSDVKGNKPGLFVRRQLKGLDGAITNRIVLPSSPIMAIGSDRVLSFGEIGYEQIGLAIRNAKVIAEFKVSS